MSRSRPAAPLVTPLVAVLLDGFRWWLRTGENTSEPLGGHPEQHEQAVDTGLDRAQVRHRGAGIPPHVNGRGATACCVWVPRWFVHTVTARLGPARHPVIAIGR